MAVRPQSLKDLAKTVRNVGSKLAPRKTGNLRNALRSFNTPERMTKIDAKGQPKVTFFVAPPGATYGKYWNDPDIADNVRNQKTGNKASIDYGKKAWKDSEVKAAMKKYAKETGKQIAKDLRLNIRKELGAK